MLAPYDPRHGTRNGYANHGCRCDACRLANTAYCREWKRVHEGRTGLTRAGWVASLRARPIKHGTLSAYKRRGCRCDLCRRASADKKARQRARARAMGVA